MVEWTPARVERRLRETALTLACTAPVDGDRLDLDVVLPGGAVRAGAPQATCPLTETLSWTDHLDPTDRAILWLRASGVRWKLICWRVGLQRSAAHQRWRYGLYAIAMKLNGRDVASNMSKTRLVKLARS